MPERTYLFPGEYVIPPTWSGPIMDLRRIGPVVAVEPEDDDA